MASESAPPYAGLLVDWGGVMTTSVFGTFRDFCTAEGLSPETIGERFRHDPASRELLVGLETGKLAEADFEPRFAALLGVPASGLIDRLFAGSHLEPAMIDAVRRARAGGVRTGLISNSWGTRRYDRALLDELFDGVVISGEEGMRKPTPAIYELGAERIGLVAPQCVFVDDLPHNLEPAAALGMATVHHLEAAGTVAKLERLLGLALG